VVTVFGGVRLSASRPGRPHPVPLTPYFRVMPENASHAAEAGRRAEPAYTLRSRQILGGAFASLLARIIHRLENWLALPRASYEAAAALSHGHRVRNFGELACFGRP
jgi:hypothetical protein